jgi:hypothetical protein
MKADPNVIEAADDEAHTSFLIDEYEREQRLLNGTCPAFEEMEMGGGR